jgi:predicted transcriptional regulator
MTDKQLVTRDESDRTHIYRASCSETETQRQLVDDLMDRAFGGSAMQLVMRALSGRQTSETDLAEIRRLLDEHDGDKR